LITATAGLIALVVGSLTPAEAQPDTLPLRHVVRAGSVELGWPDLARVEVAGAYRYVAGRRFVLRGAVDVEQHAFVVSDSSGLVRRLLWIQIEHYLPTASGTYDYEQDSSVSVSGHALRFSRRQYTSPPDSTSDRGALYALLRRAGLTPPVVAERMRWVKLSADRRSEVMIIHAEGILSSSGPTDATAATERMVRAQEAFRLVPRSEP
jgi:hypothetical protein